MTGGAPGVGGDMAYTSQMGYINPCQALSTRVNLTRVNPERSCCDACDCDSGRAWSYWLELSEPLELLELLEF